MLEPVEFLLLVAAVAGGWFVVLSLRTREQANKIARKYCKDSGVQFLDGSVGFGTLGLARENGRWLLRRVYVFDFSENNLARRHGAIIFVAGQFKTLLLLDT